MNDKQHPNDLPDIETLEDILMEIKDTDDYQSGEIKIHLNNTVWWSDENMSRDLNMNTYKPDTDVKVVYEAVMPKMNLFSPINESSGVSEMTTVSIKKNVYEVSKLLVHLNIECLMTSYETMSIVTETIERLKDYLGDNIIKESKSDVQYESGSRRYIYDRKFNKTSLLFNVFKIKILSSSNN